MDVIKAGQIVALMLSPTLVVGAALYGRRGLRAARRLVGRRGPALAPAHPPIERLASDLRRLLQRYEVIKASPHMAKRAQHLLAVEAAITDCAIEAALALGVPCPTRPTRGLLAAAELRVLLGALATAGLVLRPTPGLLAAEDSS